MTLPLLLFTGVLAGILAGLFGVGGGLIIVPALVFILGYSQTTASGISLVSLLGPVGLGGVYAYYQAGKIGSQEIKIGILISIGMFLGSYLGAKAAVRLPDVTLKRAFCVFLVVVAVKLWMETLKKSGA